MAFEEIGGKPNYIKYKNVAVGDSWEGYYEGTGASKEYPDSPSLFLRTSDGEKVGLPLSGLLKYLIQDISRGDYIKVIYKGLSDKKIKGHYPHNFQLLKDSSRSKRGGSEEWEDMNEEEVYTDVVSDDDVMPF